jgi:adenylate cyclase
LIDALNGHHLWSERYDREIKNLFELQDEITIKILDAMKLNLTEGWVEYHYKKAKTTNLKAYEKNYQGITHNRRVTKHDNETARRLFEEAIALDPEYYWPTVLLGYTYFNEARNGWSESPAKSIQKAFEWAQKAIALDDSNDYGYALSAFLYLVMRQHDKALAAAEKALAVNPNSAWAYFTLASVAGYAGQWEQSILYEKQAMRLNPILDPWDYAILGRAYFMTSKYGEAIEESKKAIKVNPNYLGAHLLLAEAYSSSGRAAEAEVAAKEVLRINPQFSVEGYSKIPPYKNRADLDRELAALRQAGFK